MSILIEGIKAAAEILSAVLDTETKKVTPAQGLVRMKAAHDAFGAHLATNAKIDQERQDMFGIPDPAPAADGE